jgi:hypothetical protein
MAENGGRVSRRRLCRRCGSPSWSPHSPYCRSHRPPPEVRARWGGEITCGEGLRRGAQGGAGTPRRPHRERGCGVCPLRRRDCPRRTLRPRPHGRPNRLPRPISHEVQSGGGVEGSGKAGVAEMVSVPLARRDCSTAAVRVGAALRIGSSLKEEQPGFAKPGCSCNGRPSASRRPVPLPFSLDPAGQQLNETSTERQVSTPRPPLPRSNPRPPPSRSALRFPASSSFLV